MNDDPELNRRFVTGDDAAFDAIVALYAPRVAALAYRLLGWRGKLDDVVQDVFLAALERRGQFRGDSSLWTWLTAITLNRCRSNWRRSRLWRLFAAANVLPKAAPPADATAIADETSAQVRRAVAQLPGRLREVMVLYYLQEMPVREICRSLGISQAAAEVRLHRGRDKLRGELAVVMEQTRR